jgi:hypothetical protein
MSTYNENQLHLWAAELMKMGGPTTCFISWYNGTAEQGKVSKAVTWGHNLSGTVTCTITGGHTFDGGTGLGSATQVWLYNGAGSDYVVFSASGTMSSADWKLDVTSFTFTFSAS